MFSPPCVWMGAPAVVGVQGLSDLTQYVEEVAKLVERPYFRSSQYTFLYLEESKLKDLPGVAINLDDEIWLKVERLIPSLPPESPAPIKPWITLSSDPTKPPSTKDHIVIPVSAEEAEKWITLGRASRDDVRQRPGGHPDEVDVFLRLNAFPETRVRIKEYVEGPWSAWSANEKAVRATKVVYEKLFSLQKAIEAGTLSKPLEIMWGAGMLHWKHPQVGLVHHPLIEIPVELLIDPETAAVSIRPVGRQPRLAENLISAMALEGSANLLSKASKFLSQGESGIISPFAPDTFTPLLKFVTTYLDPEGEFDPDPDDDTGKQTIGDHLMVTATWAIYARPRTENFIIEDLRKQREKLELRHSGGEPLPGVLKKLMRLESDSATPPQHPSPFPSAGPHQAESEQQFFLPKAHNDEQIEIIRKLDALDQAGAVVQGPPGTGKTHTIANIICHFLATGRRVLVASHSEGALNVLREQIPEGIRDLTVSILTSERAGIEQLEKAVRQIEQVTSLNSPGALATEIEKQSTICIDCRQKLSAIDNQLKQFAEKHLAGLGGQPKRAWEWAEMVVQSAGTHSWLPDCVSSAQPLFGEEDIDQVREARKVLGRDIALVTAKLPSLGDLPDPTTVASIHADILTHERLSTELSGSGLPSLSVHQHLGRDCAEVCKRALEAVITALNTVQEVPWLKPYLVGTGEAPTVVEGLFDKVSTLAKRRLGILADAVSVPPSWVRRILITLASKSTSSQSSASCSPGRVPARKGKA